MGANGKHDATHHGGEYTPDYTYVKTIFAMNAKTPVSGGHPDILWEERNEQFDRWLESVRAEAKAEALREVASDLENASVSPIWCWDKCGDPKCRDDIRVDTATEIQSWIRDRADKQ